jgi:two-component system nitrate/nitrite response regulator NarL
LVVVDDHTLFRRGLIGLLDEMPEFTVAGEAGDGASALKVIRVARPDLVLLDVNMPDMNGLEALREIRREAADLPVVMLTISRDDESLLGAIAAGANGYLLKNAEPEALRDGILRVLNGQSIISPEVTSRVFDAVRRLQHERGRGLLSEREREVLGCMRRGLTTSQISRELFISENTVKTHISHILEKLTARSRGEAVLKAEQLGIL